MKVIFSFILIYSLVSCASKQFGGDDNVIKNRSLPETIPVKMKQYQKKNHWVYGEGIGFNKKEAKVKSLAQISEKIHGITIEQATQITEEQLDIDGELTEKSKTDNSIKAYTIKTTLQGADEIDSFCSDGICFAVYGYNNLPFEVRLANTMTKPCPAKLSFSKYSMLGQFLITKEISKKCPKPSVNLIRHNGLWAILNDKKYLYINRQQLVQYFFFVTRDSKLVIKDGEMRNEINRIKTGKHYFLIDKNPKKADYLFHIDGLGRVHRLDKYTVSYKLKGKKYRITPSSQYSGFEAVFDGEGLSKYTTEMFVAFYCKKPVNLHDIKDTSTEHPDNDEALSIF